MKILSRFTTLTLGVALVASTLTLASERQLVDSSPAKVEFAWDLHDTLFTINKMAMAKTILANLSCRETGFAIAGLFGGSCLDYINYGITGTEGNRQHVVSGIINLIKKGAVGEEYFNLIGSYDPNLGQLAEKLACEFSPIAGMKELLAELHTLGYKQRLASNIGGGAELTNMRNKFPEIFQYIDGGKAIAYQGSTNRTKKPDIQYFNEYQDEFNGDREKTIVFVDDKEKNTSVAQQTGMIGMIFKNTDQLRTDLKTLGIALN